MLDVLGQQVVAAASGGDAVRGTVRVAAPEGFGSLFAAPALARVRMEHPGIALELITSTRPLSQRGSGFDLAVTIGAPGGSRIRAELLTEYALPLFAAPGYLAARPPIRTTADLEGHDLVFYVDALLTVRELDLATLGLEGSTCACRSCSRSAPTAPRSTRSRSCARPCTARSPSGGTSCCRRGDGERASVYLRFCTSRVHHCRLIAER